MNRRDFLALAGAAAIAPAVPKADGRFIPVGDIMPAQPNARTYTNGEVRGFSYYNRCVSYVRISGKGAVLNSSLRAQSSGSNRLPRDK
jgi:hypothetical protein